MFGRRSTGITPRRGGIAAGTFLSLLAPFVIRKLMQRRAQHGYGPAY